VGALSLRTSAVAASAFFKSLAAPTTCAPCAASARAVSTPSPAETPVTRILLPCSSIPAKTSSVVEVGPNTLVPEVAANTVPMFVVFNYCETFWLAFILSLLAAQAWGMSKSDQLLARLHSVALSMNNNGR
jgi:hypothetical protein